MVDPLDYQIVSTQPGAAPQSPGSPQ
jgi:hypothetical protein